MHLSLECCILHKQISNLYHYCNITFVSACSDIHLTSYSTMPTKPTPEYIHTNLPSHIACNECIHRCYEVCQLFSSCVLQESLALSCQPHAIYMTVCRTKINYLVVCHNISEHYQKDYNVYEGQCQVETRTD